MLEENFEKIFVMKNLNLNRKLFFLLLTLFLVGFGCWLIVNREKEKKAEKEVEKIRPTYAGKIGFYPSEKDSLQQEVYRLLSSASPKNLNGNLVGLVVPHAGYPFSGQTAAQAYALLSGRSYSTVVILGTAHQAAVQGAAIDSSDAYETPLGKVLIDKEAAQEIIKNSRFAYYDSLAHLEEHSVEVQLPFLQTVLSKFKIVPIVMGSFSWDYVEDLSNSLAKLARQKESLLLIASSDLSHYYPYDQAVKMDRNALKEVLNLDSQKLFKKIKSGQCEMCGETAVITLMETIKKIGATRAQLLDYRNSGDVTGDRSRVVGYSAVAFLKSLTLESENWLDKEEQKTLLKIARETLKSYLKNGKAPQFNISSENLLELRGAFVTLKKNGELRGCIGHIEADKPLYQIVSEMAIAAATSDPRFPPVNLNELSRIKIEISVLSPMKKVENIKEIKVGRDGLVIRKGFYQGLLLPQVPVEWGWNREEFLRQVAIKASLPPDAWKEAELYRFSAQVFSER